MPISPDAARGESKGSPSRFAPGRPSPIRAADVAVTANADLRTLRGYSRRGHPRRRESAGPGEWGVPFRRTLAVLKSSGAISTPSAHEPIPNDMRVFRVLVIEN
jgi:hypothetical protein